MDAVGLDFETELFAPGNMAPRPVCLTVATASGVEIVHWSDAAGFLAHALRGVRPVAISNAAYDMGIVLAHYPELSGDVFSAYERGIIKDIQIQQKLIDLALGEYRRHGLYSLAGLTKRFFGVELDKDSGVRTDFAWLRDLPVSGWPQTHIDYAKADARYHRECYLEQINGLIAEDRLSVLENHDAQARAAFALHLGAAWGLVTDPVQVNTLRKRTTERMAELHQGLVDAGILTPTGSRKVRNAQAMMVEAHGGYDRSLLLTPKGRELRAAGDDAWQQPKYVAVTAEACRDSHHATLNAYAEYSHLGSLLSGHIKAVDTDQPIHTRYDVLMETGRTSSSGPNIQNIRREPGARECFVPRPGCVFAACDYDKVELHTLAEVCIRILGGSSLGEALNQGYDPHTAVGATLAGVSYDEGVQLVDAGDAAMTEWRRRAKPCFHPDTEILTERRGWVRIGDLQDGEAVAAAYPQTHGRSLVRWEVPYELTRRAAPESTLVHVENEGINLRVTSEHRMLGFGQDGAPKVVAPEALPDARWVSNAGVMGAGKMPGGSMAWLPLLELVVATQADGSYSGAAIRFGFTRQRKIDRLDQLLRRADPKQAEWSRSPPRDKVVTFRVMGRLARRIRSALTEDKMFPLWVINLPLALRERLLAELPHWDGHVHPHGRRFTYSTTRRQNADVVQAVASLSGRKARLTVDPPRKPGHAPCWQVSVGDHASSRVDSATALRIPYDGEVVCLSVPSSFVLVRDGGVAVVCGQCNFGFPGGMGPKGMRAYAKGAYGVVMTTDEATELYEGWKAQWPELPDYLEWIQSLCRGTGVANIKHLISNRWRCNIPYTVAANSFFQGMAADGAKAAAWEICRRQYHVPGSALYGTRTVAFIHDEFVLECPEDRANAAAWELRDVMVEQFNRFTEHVPVRATPCLMDRWSKKAKTILNDKGELEVWRWEPDS